MSLFNSSQASHFPRLCVHMILLCTELSLPAHFVKSLFSLRWLASLISQGQLVSWTAGARRTPVPLCVCSLDTLTLFNPPSPPIRLPPVPSTPVAVLLSFYLLSPGTHITRLTSNSKASPQDGPSGTSSLCPHTHTHRKHNSQGICGTAGGKHHDTSQTHAPLPFLPLHATHTHTYSSMGQVVACGRGR